MPKRSAIFISYRVEDSSHAVARLANDLAERFPDGQVFHDLTSIAPGEDFTAALRRGLETCAVALVVIGPRWSTLEDGSGRRRLGAPGDWVTYEVSECLSNDEIRVIPLLIDGTAMPRAEELPEGLAALARRQALPLTVRHWKEDVRSILQMAQSAIANNRPPEVDALPDSGRPSTGRPSGRVAIAAGALLVILLASGLFLMGDRLQPRSGTASADTRAPGPPPAPPESAAALGSTRGDASPLPADPASSSIRGFVVQLGAYDDTKTVRSVRSRAEAIGLKTYTQQVDLPTGTRTRVRVGPFASRDEAQSAAGRLNSEGLSAHVLEL